MSIALAHSGAGEQNKYYSITDSLTRDQKECLGKIFGDIANQGHLKGDKPDDIAAEIADFIRNTVLKGNPDYCVLYRRRLDDPDRSS